MSSSGVPVERLSDDNREEVEAEGLGGWDSAGEEGLSDEMLPRCPSSFTRFKLRRGDFPSAEVDRVSTVIFGFGFDAGRGGSMGTAKPCTPEFANGKVERESVAYGIWCPLTGCCSLGAAAGVRSVDANDWGAFDLRPLEADEREAER